MRFGMFVPQGWRHDLVGIETGDQWQVMHGLAAYADAADSGWDTIWVYDHFHTVPVAVAHRGDARGVDADGGVRRVDQPGAHRPDVHVHELPQPGLPREGRRDGRHHLGRPRRDGHRRRLVRARVARLRLRLPADPRAARTPARGRRDHAPGLDDRAGDPRRQVLPGRRRDRAAAAPAGRAASPSGSPAEARR